MIDFSKNQSSCVTQQMTKAFLPQMKTTNHGHIVTVASALGLFSTACVEVRHKITDSLDHNLNRQILDQSIIVHL